MKKNGVVGLSVPEKEIVEMLNDKEFTVDFIQDWLTNPPKNIDSDSYPARIQGRVEGFLAAVNQLKQSFVKHLLVEQHEREGRIEDIINVINDNADDWAESGDFDAIGDFEALIGDKEFMSKVLQRFEKILGNNDSYWESYWESARNAVEDVMTEKIQKQAA